MQSWCSSPEPGRRREDTAQGLKGAAALPAASQHPLGHIGSPKADCEGRRPQIPRAGAIMWPEDAGRPLAPAEASARTNFPAQSLLSSKSTCLSQKAGLPPARAYLPLPSGSAACVPPMSSAPLSSHPRVLLCTWRWPRAQTLCFPPASSAALSLIRTPLSRRSTECRDRVSSPAVSGNGTYSSMRRFCLAPS